MAGHLSDQGSGIREVLASQMNQPSIPGSDRDHAGTDRLRGFLGRRYLQDRADVTIRTTPLNHPDGATGYRVEHRGHAFCYVTDFEHVVSKPDERILALIEGADIVAYDCTYSDKEFDSKIGWGHSTWQEGMRLCQAANVHQHIIFHHDPDHEDMYMERLEEEARFSGLATLLPARTCVSG